GSGTSSIRSPCVPPNSWNTTAFMNKPPRSDVPRQYYHCSLNTQYIVGASRFRTPWANATRRPGFSRQFVCSPDVPLMGVPGGRGASDVDEPVGDRRRLHRVHDQERRQL